MKYKLFLLLFVLSLAARAAADCEPGHVHDWGSWSEGACVSTVVAVKTRQCTHGCCVAFQKKYVIDSECRGKNRPTPPEPEKKKSTVHSDAGELCPCRYPCRAVDGSCMRWADSICRARGDSFPTCRKLDNRPSPKRHNG